ncbi:MAG: hypothetical protein ABJA79_04300 [Parafilimonas sp.]
MAMWLYGAKDTAHVQFLAAYPQYTALTVGSYGVTNTTDLIYQFQTWTKLALVARNKKLSVYRDEILIKSIDYSGTKIGSLKRIKIAFKCSGSVDWVNLHNSNTGKKLMQENFNVDGQSSVVWY